MECFSVLTFKRDSLVNPAEKMESIFKGWKYSYFESESIEKMAKSRAEICSKCPKAEKSRIFIRGKSDKIESIQGMSCAVCGCGLSEKLRSELEKCPLDKWKQEKK